MTSVRLTCIGTAFPQYWVTQAEAARWIGAATGDHRRVSAVARNTQIEKRAICVSPDELSQLKTIEDRNQVYQRLAPPLALDAARAALGDHPGCNAGMLVAVSCTGYMVPGWDGRLGKELDLSPRTVRLPITQAGCAGGVLALGRAAEHLKLHPERDALVVSAELCSLAFHPDLEPGNLTSVLIFGDGAGAALLRANDEAASDGLEIVDSLSSLVPDSRDDLGFALTNKGFKSVLSREVADVLAEPTIEAVRDLLCRHELQPGDVDFWLVHAGGPRILSGVEACFDLAPGSLRWSWQTRRETGNTSSASIFEVLRRYMTDPDAPSGWGIVLAFGPGVSIEVLLVHSQPGTPRRCS
jgi:predicted naringenin-chalcone synthase